MSSGNIIQDHNTVKQGKSVFNNPLQNYLRIDYFKAEPRTVLYWVAFIREISKEKNIESYGYFWNNLLPSELSNDLLAEYIENPRGTIADERFTDEEITELRQPQRILLFYFIRKLAEYYAQNDVLIENVNMEISENIFRMYPKSAVPDRGYITIEAEDDSYVEIGKGELMECVVEGEQITRIYETDSVLYGNPLQIDSFWMATPVAQQNHLLVVEQPLPLEQTIAPFRFDQEYKSDEQTIIFYTPSLIISSTLLCLRQGTRVIKLKMKVQVEETQRDNFSFQITTSDKWVSLPTQYITLEQVWDEDYLLVTITIEPEFQPIAPLSNPADEEAYLNKHSGILMSLDVKKEVEFNVDEITMSVDVDGLYPEAIRNQEQVLGVDDDYQPFGVDAELQSTFSFTHRELTHPQLATIELYPEWVAVPHPLNEYYKAYGYKKSKFQADVYTAITSPDAINSVVTKNTTIKLFDDTISFTPTPAVGISATCSSWDSDELDPLNHDIYYQLQLSKQDFGQSEYPLLMTNYAIEYGAYESRWFKGNKPPPDAVNRPYIPLWSALKIDYTSQEVTWTPDSEDNVIEVFKNEPIGYQVYKGEAITRGLDEFGAIYFGFQEITLDDMGSMLLHGDTGNPRARNVKTTWWYLGENDWVELTDYILDDKTHGFTQTGIFSWMSPADMSNTNDIMPTGYYWLKMTIVPLIEQEYPLPLCPFQRLYYFDSLMTLDGMYTNVLSIVRNEEELELSDALTPLEAGSVLTFNNSALDYAIDLPYNTFGAVPEESNLDFWVRAFSHVRNKGRMVTANDYDNLLLRDNRELSLVKAIARVSKKDYFSVVAITRQVYGNIPYDIPPILSRYELELLRNQCVTLSSPFIGNVSVPPNIKSPLDVKVMNPCYSPIGFKLYLEFEEGNTFSENQLQLFEDLQRFVNPWRYEEDYALEFGCWFDYADIITYVQNLSYVEAVFEIVLGFVENETLTYPTEYTFQEDQILVLNSSEYVVIDSGDVPVDCDGIGEMIINETFVVCNSDCSDGDTLDDSTATDEMKKGSSDATPDATWNKNEDNE